VSVAISSKHLLPNLVLFSILHVLVDELKVLTAGEAGLSEARRGNRRLYKTRRSEATEKLRVNVTSA
jgi:hypothetical protein